MMNGCHVVGDIVVDTPWELICGANSICGILTIDIFFSQDNEELISHVVQAMRRFRMDR